MDRKKILIVDDEPIQRKIFQRMLRQAGYGVFEAEKAQNVIETIKHHEINLVMVEITLPGINGLECMKMIKKQLKSTPVIMLSSYIDGNIAKDSIKMGADGYLAKPFKKRDLLNAVGKHLGRTG